MSGYRHVRREDAVDFMADYPGFGEMRWYTEALETEQVSFSSRSMPPGTGGRGSYGHRHPGREEIYFVIAGTVTFKVGDDVFEAEARSAVRIDGDAYRSVHNDGSEEAQLLVFSLKAETGMGETEKQEEFWPS
jgi:mannose-6-phosphate isomerase-like protein (cupin superfamily)